MKLLKDIMRENATDHDWPEDFDHENGTYRNNCTSCQTEFMGHKRRVTCKVCATTKDV